MVRTNDHAQIESKTTVALRFHHHQDCAQIISTTAVGKSKAIYNSGNGNRGFKDLGNLYKPELLMTK